MTRSDTPLLSSETLARKLRLLLDTMLAESGTTYQYPDIKEAMAKAGTPISRARWYYLRNGSGPAPSDAQLLTNLALFFKVDPAFLLEEDSELPDRIESQLDLLKTMRENQVRQFAARQLADLSPDTLRQIRSMIDEQLKAPAV